MSLNGLSKSVNNTASNIANRISNNLPKNLPKNTANTGSFMMAPLPTMTTAFNNTAKNVKNAASNAVLNVKNAASNAALNVKNAASNVVETVNDAAINLANNVKNTMNNNGLSGVTEPIVESINGSMESDTSPLFTIPVMIALGVLIVVLILFIVFRDQIAFGLSVAWQKTKNLFAGSPDAPPQPSAVPPAPAQNAPIIDTGALSKMVSGKKEVFNVATDKYTYTDAEPLCKAFGAELATYDQVKDAWNNGADWCNYGWVKGQAAVYPTQQTTYNKLQAGPEDQRMACGVPGVNGGYFDNPELRFGVNCYGSKPSENETDTRFAMDKRYLTPGALEYDKKVQDYTAQKDEIPVNPFKSGTWSS
jgi:hypothetical protein